MFSEAERKARRREAGKKWARAHPDQERARAKKWWLAHPDQKRAANRKWQRTHPDKARVRVRKWKLAHPDQMRAHRKKWRLAHPDRVRTSCKKWRLAHPEQERAGSRRRRLAHLEQARVRCQLYRTRKAGVPYTLTVSEWAAICAAYRQRCAYCGKKRKLEQDHVQPLSKGGGTVAANTVPACKSCNSRKNNRPPPKPVNLALGI